MHVKTRTRNLRSRKEVESVSQPLADTTNTINMRSRKKNQENVPKSLKTTSNTKPKKARNATVSKLSKSCVKGPEKDENTAPNSVLRTPDCFGFNDSDLYDDAPACKTELTEFDCNKPFRLALYVRPSKRLRINASVIEKIQKLNPTLNLTNMTMNSTLARPLSETAMSPDRTQFKVPFASTPIEKPKKKMLQMKITDSFASPKRTRSGNNVFKSYFENSETSDEEPPTPPAKIAKKRAKDNVSTVSQRKFEAGDQGEAVPVTYQRPNRRSYVKKERPPAEPEDTTPTEEILKSIEKTKKKAKPKKSEKEEEEFEKWSRSMNSMFNEVDQFEISID